MIVWNKEHHKELYHLSSGKSWARVSCPKEANIDHGRTVIYKPIVNKIRDDSLIFDTRWGEFSLVYEWDPIFNPYLLIKEVHYRTGGNSYDQFYYVGFDGPEELAVMWRLSL